MIRAILKSKYSALPAFERKRSEVKEHPRARVINKTSYGLTVWFAGRCSAKIDVAAKQEQTIQICPAKYHIAAKVDSPDFLPLVRENQDFDLGVNYELVIKVDTPPSVTKRRRR